MKKPRMQWPTTHGVGMCLSFATVVGMTDICWSFMKDLCVHSPMTLTRKICSNHADLLKSACRIPPPPHSLQKSPQVYRFSQISQWRLTDIYLQKAPPRFADFLKGAAVHLLTCACRNSPSPSLQIFSNQPMEIYWHLLAESPLGLQISSNEPLYIYWYVLAEIPPSRFADFLKWATVHLLTNACRNTPISDFLKSANGDLLTYLQKSPLYRFSQISQWRLTDMWLQKSPPVYRFSQISQWRLTDLCLQKFPHLDFLKSANTDLLTCAHRNFPSPPTQFADFLISATTCRFTIICIQNFPPPEWGVKCGRGHLHERPFICEGNYLVTLFV